VQSVDVMTSSNSVRATGCGARHYLSNASLYLDQVRKSKLAMKTTGVEIKQTQEKPSEPRLLRTLKIRDHDRGVTTRRTGSLGAISHCIYPRVMQVSANGNLKN
jgi:hypothetical protein